VAPNEAGPRGAVPRRRLASVLSWIILAIVAVPLLVLASRAVYRSRQTGEHTPGETEADRAHTEQEFEESERYQAEWREEQHKHQTDTLIP
jgi:hypothetical protein